ncbi:hypothetical protein [Pseudoflavonifractor phocaeensis]|uniref:hypothetical protein n=1 Tax=Pseudoflavonifractor phocaeensis TaxID=1870988 RepID=UPI0019570A6E|nr:hypothetical protein [Pseudoflavonifractor phocaeensis]MBM6927181.1 hypothetical protein [Pseudoflavonifractor phocaeensis]
MATYTANYGLHQWVPEDVFVRTDFNTDLSKIDAGLKTAQDTANSAATAAAAAQSTANTANTNAAAAQSTADGKAAIVTGTYTGNGNYTQTISLGFRPRAVFVERRDGSRAAYAPTGGLALNGCHCYSSASDEAIYITSSGFLVCSANVAATNTLSDVYYYLAVQ